MYIDNFSLTLFTLDCANSSLIIHGSVYMDVLEFITCLGNTKLKYTAHPKDRPV